jgi:hypothetical protein
MVAEGRMCRLSRAGFGLASALAGTETETGKGVPEADLVRIGDGELEFTELKAR